MGAFQYRIEPFIGRIRGGAFSSENAGTVAAQLQEAINQGTADGWEFYRIDQVQIMVSPGCLGALMGRRAEMISFDQLVFRRPST